MSNKVEKMGIVDVSDVVNKYLDKSESKLEKNFMSEVASFNKFDENAEASREHGVIKLRSGQVIEVSEDSELYHKVLEHARQTFLRLDAFRFINPSEIVEFHERNTLSDYSTKDVEKEVEVYDEDWKKVFFPDSDEE